MSEKSFENDLKISNQTQKNGHRTSFPNIEFDTKNNYNSTALNTSNEITNIILGEEHSSYHKKGYKDFRFGMGVQEIKNEHKGDYKLRDNNRFGNDIYFSEEKGLGTLSYWNESKSVNYKFGFYKGMLVAVGAWYYGPDVDSITQVLANLFSINEKPENKSLDVFYLNKPVESNLEICFKQFNNAVVFIDYRVFNHKKGGGNKKTIFIEVIDPPFLRHYLNFMNSGKVKLLKAIKDNIENRNLESFKIDVLKRFNERERSERFLSVNSKRNDDGIFFYANPAFPLPEFSDSAYDLTFFNNAGTWGALAYFWDKHTRYVMEAFFPSPKEYSATYQTYYKANNFGREYTFINQWRTQYNSLISSDYIISGPDVKYGRGSWISFLVLPQKSLQDL